MLNEKQRNWSCIKLDEIVFVFAKIKVRRKFFHYYRGKVKKETKKNLIGAGKGARAGHSYIY